MIVLGLTGSIGMGKSTVARQFKRMGAEVFEADRAVHELMTPDGKAFDSVTEAFPECLIDGKIDRKKLGDIVFENPNKLKRLEAIIHPLVRKMELEFLQKNMRQREKIVVLDIPLLYETGTDELCDYVAVVRASCIVQKNRVGKRGGIDTHKFNNINQLQMPTNEKINLADFVINTGLDKREVLKQVRGIMNQLKG